jgi:hypothetical protein
VRAGRGLMKIQPQYFLGGTGETMKNSARIVDITAGIRTEKFQSMSLEC